MLCIFYYQPTGAQNRLPGRNLSPRPTEPPDDTAQNPKPVGEAIKRAKAFGARFEKRSVFQQFTRGIESQPQVSAVLEAGSILEVDQPAIEQMLAEKNGYMNLALPNGKGGTVELELSRSDIFAAGFSVKTAVPSDDVVEESLGVHYRGIVRGDYRSVAAISVFKNEVVGFYSTEAGGDTVIGRFGGENPNNEHVLYATKDMKVSPEFSCHADETRVSLPVSPLQMGAEAVANACVRIYLEANYDLFQNKGSVAATVSYLTALFNQSAILFANDGVAVSISEIFVWNSPSPYIGSPALGMLQQFRSNRTTFNGDLAHLVTLGNSGIAYVDVLCDRSNAYAASGVFSTFSNVPTFSWTVDVFTHETGHNLGSDHTHACVWNGNHTAIDGCAAVEGFCPQPGLPAGGGTIMSYCHNTAVGTNFTLGFGPQPRAVIVNRFNAANCLTSCSQRRTRYDYTGDSKADIGVWRGADGVWYLINSSSNALINQQWGNQTLGDVPVGGDFDGDGKFDYAVWRPQDGTWYIINSSDGGIRKQQWGNQTLGDVPTPADFDGDNKTDIAVWRASIGTWYIINSANGSVTNRQWGSQVDGDRPVAGDYDGDHKADIAVWRSSIGTWYIINSSNNTVRTQQWGNPGLGDTPVVADFDGDLKTEIGVWRSSNGTWYLIYSSDNSARQQQWGVLSFGDKPVPADFDGDGKADISIWRSVNGTWYIINSSNGSVRTQQWGNQTLGDVPTPAF